MKRLDISGTQVEDLRPLTGLSHMAEQAFSSLIFENTPAVASDPILRRLSEERGIEDSIKPLFEHLNKM